MEGDHFLVPKHGGLYVPASSDEQFFLLGGGGAAAAAAAGRGERKRRFTEEQTRSLESMFHAQPAARLEPREKAELARELGLQPRQVAIWFQNKRARWRSKQLEKDYAALRAQYDELFGRVEALKQEKQLLAAQLQDLGGKLKQQQQQQQDRSGTDGVSTTASSSCSSEELDEKGNFFCSAVEPAIAPADLPVEPELESGHLARSGSFPELSFCATPELWEPWPWPLVEWNVVA